MYLDCFHLRYQDHSGFQIGYLGSSGIYSFKIAVRVYLYRDVTFLFVSYNKNIKECLIKEWKCFWKLLKVFLSRVMTVISTNEKLE